MKDWQTPGGLKVPDKITIEWLRQQEPGRSTNATRIFNVEGFGLIPDEIFGEFLKITEPDSNSGDTQMHSMCSLHGLIQKIPKRFLTTEFLLIKIGRAHA